MPLRLNMFRVIMIVAGFVILALFQVPKMVKKGLWWDLTLYIIIFTLAFYYTLAYFVHWPFLDPERTVTALMQGIYRALGYNTPS